MSIANRVFDGLDRALDVLVLLVCVLLLLIGVYSTIDNLQIYQNASDRSILAFKPSLDYPMGDTAISPDQAAWLHIEGTAIDYPIMQAEDNNLYLNTDPYGDFSLSGSIFLDCRNNKNLTDDYSLIYGHHMEHGVMFGSLDRFTDQAYFDSHSTGVAVTQEKVYDLTLFAVASTDATDRVLFNPKGRTISEITEYLQKNSMIYTTPEADLPILALSTCSGDTFTARLLVFGTLKAR